ncbi:GDSL-type esterase/lipase family protein [Syntrophomonas erecta]
MNRDKKIVCLGDSITWGFPYGHQDSWVEMLGQALNQPVINQGVNGNTTGDMLFRFDRVVQKHHPTHMIIMGGINDVLGQESFDRIVLNLKIIVENALNQGITVIMGTPTAVDEPCYERNIMRIREWIHRFADQKGLQVIDFHQAFYNERGEVKTELLLPDGGHPTREGYQAIFRQIDLNLFK